MKKFFFIASAILLTWAIGNCTKVFTDNLAAINSGCYEKVLVDGECYAKTHSIGHCRIK